MRCASLLLLLAVAAPAHAASKPHSVTLGKPLAVKLMVGASDNQTVDITVRPLVVDGKVKEFVTGSTHDVTEREFAVRRAYRINDALPDDAHPNPRWLWQRGGWLLVNRVSGKVSALKLPEFDTFYSEVSWYRDYAAYCGISSSGERVIAVIAQIGSSKPLFHRDLGTNSHADANDSDCAAPRWERQPARVTFLPKVGEKFTVNVSGRYADLAAERGDDEE